MAETSGRLRRTYPFPGLTKAQRRIVDEIGSGNSDLAYVFADPRSIAKLIDAGIIAKVSEKQIGNGWSAIKVPVYEMPVSAHILWCQWCAEEVRNG